MYPLEHFYYGQLVHHGKPKGDMRVLARSGAVQESEVSAVVRTALVPPHEDIPDVSWAMVRSSKPGTFVMAQAQKGSAGQTTFHFILVPADALRAASGNLALFLNFIKKQMPIYEQLGDELMPLTLNPPKVIPKDEQVDLLLDLMTYTRNNPRGVIQPLLAALVQGNPITITHAPADLNKRTRFLQGLLLLLPGSTRFGVTFATHLEDKKSIKTQIAFLDGEPASDALIFDWSAAAIYGDVDDHDYARFMISQLRLDTELVIQQTDSLTPVAGWRYKNGDSLAEALAYASKRSRVDKALSNNMPVEVQEASKILAEDPTLDDEMRATYVRHLLTFSLALDDMTYAEPIVAAIEDDVQLTQEVRQQINDALKDHKGILIFETLYDWIQSPGLDAKTWGQLTQKAALKALEELVQARDYDAINQFLDNLQALGVQWQMSRVVPQVLQALLPHTSYDGALPTRLLLVAMRYLDREAFQHLLTKRLFTQYLSPPVKNFLMNLSTQTEANGQGTLLAAARSVDRQYRTQVMLRLSDLATQVGRTDLVDATALRALGQLALQPETDEQLIMIIDVARNVMRQRAGEMDEESAKYILQILLIGKQNDVLAEELLRQSRDLYGGERQYEFVQMVFRLFLETPLDAEAMNRTLKVLKENKVRGMPLLVAGCGALGASDWSPELRPTALSNVQKLEQDRRYLTSIQPEVISTLLRYFIERGEGNGVLRAARLLPTAAAHQEGAIGLSTVNDAFKRLSAHKKLQPIAFEVVRQYVREADDKPAQRIIAYFGRELGDTARRRLEMAYDFSRMMGQMTLPTFGAAINSTLALLRETMEAYMNKAKKPTTLDLTNTVNNIRIGMDERERRELAVELRKMAKAIVILGSDFQSRSSRSNRYLEAITRGDEDPRSILDILRASAGYLARGKTYSLQLKPHTTPDPFQGMKPDDLRLTIIIASDVLGSAVRAFNTGEASRWTIKDIQDEIDGIRRMTDSEEIRDVLLRLAIDWQHMVDLVMMIQHEGNNDAVEDDNRLGRRIEQRKHQPRSTLEMYRFVYGYFLSPQD